jgi:hypothetical protein
MEGFPQHTRSAKQGNAGVGIVSRIVEDEFGWLFRQNHQERDFGIDGQIDVVTESGPVTGQMLGCQIKCGSSFFRETDRWGFVYRGEIKHFNFLANYPLPVIVIICDPDSGEGYWARFGPTEAQIMEAGWKLTIPHENKLSSSKAALEGFLPPVADHLTRLREYWRINNLLLGFEIILFTVARGEVESADISRVEDFWRRLLRHKGLALHCQGKISFSFSGYDEDPRECFEIEDIRRYIALLDEAVPELFFFARAEEPAHTLKLFLFFLGGTGWEGERSTPGNPRKVIVDYDVLKPFFERHFLYLTYISEFLGLEVEEMTRIGDAVYKTRCETLRKCKLVVCEDISNREIDIRTFHWLRLPSGSTDGDVRHLSGRLDRARLPASRGLSPRRKIMW